MKILYIITGLGMGGAEHVVVNLAEQAYLQGHEVTIAYLTGKINIRPSKQAINIIGINMNGYKDFFRAYWALKKIIIKFKPDVVHSHMVHANLLTRLIRIIVPIPRLVCTAHSTNEGGKLRMLAYRLTHRLADYTTNVSDEAARALELKGAAPNRGILTVANGIDTERFKPNNKDMTKVRSFNLVSVGRLEKVKDYPTLLHALKILELRGVVFKLQVIGDGSEKESLNNLTKQLKLHSYVDWLGVRTDVHEVIAAADIFILSSIYEGSPLVIAEAMASCLGVVATDCGGVKEVLGSDTWLVPIKNPKALANKIEAMIALDKLERDKIGLENRGRAVEHYSLALMFKNYMNLYLY